MSLPGGQQFFALHFGTATVTKVYPIDPKDRRLYADAIPLDTAGQIRKAPVFQMPGVKRNVRRGMQVGVWYALANPQYPVLLAHTPNADTDSTYADPLALPFENMGDMVIDHPETGAFMRFRDANASAGKASAVDGGPILLEVSFRSGMRQTFMEYNPDGYPKPAPPDPKDGSVPKKLQTPPKPPRADFKHDMPGGAHFHMLEPTTKESKTELATAKGAKLAMDDVAKASSFESAGDDKGKKHSVLLDDANRALKILSAAGHLLQLDDEARQIVMRTVGKLESKMDDELKRIVHTAGAVSTVLDGELSRIEHVAETVALGATVDKLDAVANAGLRHLDQVAYEASHFAQRLQDMIQLVTTINASGGFAAGTGTAVIAAVKAIALKHLKLSDGSASVLLE